MNVSIVGAGSTYGIFVVKWALQLKHFPETNREKVTIPQIGNISYSNTNERNRDLVMEILQDDLSHMPSFVNVDVNNVTKDVHGYTNWREMISKETPGLIVLCSPLQTHVPYMRELLSDFNVKNILCEPPLSHLHEVEALPKLAEMAEAKKVAIGTNQQYSILYERMRDVPLTGDGSQNAEKFGSLFTGLTGMEIVFITHGTRNWRKMMGVGEQEILEDLGLHVLELIPKDLRDRKITIQNVNKEGDNLFLNYVEYELTLGDFPVRITLGYHRKLKSLKVIFKKDKKDYEFHISGAINPETGEFTRWIEGKNYAYPFKHYLDTDLVKASFISSLAGKPIVPIKEGIKHLEFIRTLYFR